MVRLAKRFVQLVRAHQPWQRLLIERKSAREVAEWESTGRPDPPPHLVKQRVVVQYAADFHLKVLVETGTYHGDMIEAVKEYFERIYSIELSDTLHAEAHKRFKKSPHITLLAGDSGQILERLMGRIDQPALFWLDAHYSGGATAQGESNTPILMELQHILAAPNHGHVTLIDDARLFGADPAYPTMDALKELVRSRQGNLEVMVQNDIIRITPSGAKDPGIEPIRAPR